MGLLVQPLLSLIVSVVLALLAFYLGQLVERDKLQAQDDRLAVQNRRQLFAATAQDFGVYLTHWNRMRTVAIKQQELQVKLEEMEARESEMKGKETSVSAMERAAISIKVRRARDTLDRVTERLERYVKSRDEANDRLYGNFEQARLFFAQPTIDALRSYETFDRANGTKSIVELPPMDEWRRLATLMFDQMRIEIRNDEKKLNSSNSGSPASRQ